MDNDSAPIEYGYYTRPGPRPPRVSAEWNPGPFSVSLWSEPVPSLLSYTLPR